MIKKLILFVLLSFFISLNSFSSTETINSLKKGGKIIFIRHALAPGTGDPTEFKLNNCSTQRNLNKEGIEQSKKIGFFFKKNQIPIDEVLSSEWCRCKDTAKYAFKNYKTFNALNSFFDKRFKENKDKQIEELRKYIDNWKGKKNLVLITHYVVILEILNQATSSGEIIISDTSLSILAKVNDY